MPRYIALTILLLINYNLFATHNRAGEITYRQLSNLTFEITIITYTYSLSPADRPELDISWGDGTNQTINRIDKINLPDDINYNRYVATHTYAAPSTYIISFEDPNRNANVINIPNSVNVPFYVESTLIINPFLGINNSPTLLNPPIDNACLNKTFIHNPGAYDIDGDSISYELVNCKGEEGLEIPGYTFPSASNSITIDNITGDLVWNSPQSVGEYNIAIQITEWRKGIKIGSITRDMQIDVAPCTNNPPNIADINDTCIEAGKTLFFRVQATDPDLNQSVTLTGTSGLFLLADNPADFLQPTTSISSVFSDFTWQTTCNNIRKTPYTVSFKAVDNGSPIELVDFETVNIKVVGPAITNLTATPVGNNIHLTWDKTICLNAIGYKIYRRTGYFGFIPDNCEVGVPEYTGYVYIKDIDDIDETFYTDSNNGQGLFHGNDYCYLVIAYYPDGSESYASNEACAVLKRDVPIITNVSITETSSSTGKVYLAWSKPTELDTSIILGPFKYFVYRSTNLNSGPYILIDSLNGLNDTLYTDTSLNTISNQYSYRIDLINDTPNDRYVIGPTHYANSIFLEITPQDNKLKLTWQVMPPWNNNKFEIFKLNEANGQYEYLDFATTNTYTDINLVNGRLYCYYVKSIGSYTLPNIINPIINLSQKVCASPVDMTPSCPPVLNISVDCGKSYNYLVWNNPNLSCADDVSAYKVYFSSDATQTDLQFLIYKNSALDTFLYHSPEKTIAGCYGVTALDSNANESQMSNIICVNIDSCALYSLPNVFTPNSDGFNDFFVPFPYNFVEKIDLKIYNRWGNLVFTTNNPDINWDGIDINTKQKVTDGVYFYLCEVFEIRLEGITSRYLNGCIHVLSN